MIDFFIFENAYLYLSASVYTWVPKCTLPNRSGFVLVKNSTMLGTKWGRV